MVSDVYLEEVPMCVKLLVEPCGLFGHVATSLFVGYGDDHMRQFMKCVTQDLAPGAY